MSAEAGNVLLQKKIQLLREGTDYRLLLETAATLAAQRGSQELRDEQLAAIADEVLRPIAADLSQMVKGSKIMLHVYITGG